MSATAERDLRGPLGPEAVLPGVTRQYLTDATESRAVVGRADAIALPGDAQQVADVVRWCYDHDVALIPRGGGTGLAAGAVPTDGGIVLSLERLRAVRSLEGELWRAHVEAGITTADVAWVTGREFVLAPGELISIGGPVRKDVAGYDIKSLLVGSEGTLAVVTAAWLRLTPAPESQLPIVAFYESAQAGCQALGAVLASGLLPAALEYLDEGAVTISSGAFPDDVPRGAAFMVIAEADGSLAEAQRLRTELVEVLGEHALSLHAPADRRTIAELWRWRAGASIAITAQRGGKVSEDIVVPFERLAEAVAATREIGARHGLEACSWGHAGDGNLHSTFMIAPADPDQLRRAELAASELFALACELGGSVSGEHGLGLVKAGALRQQGPEPAGVLHQ